MVFATGDTHGNFLRFQPENFPEQETMTKNDYVIICGDFGGVWNDSDEEHQTLDWLESLPFTVLFISGNHENFDLLKRLPIEEWHGGKVQFVRPHVIHLLRGQAFEIEGYTFFTMGGASSHDIADGILNPYADDFEEQYWFMRRRRCRFRVNHYSWWKEELPSDEEYAEARKTLERIGWAADYIITHCAPNSIVKKVNPDYTFDRLTTFLEKIRRKAKFHYWLFAHYHDNKIIDGRYVLLWEQIVQII